VKNLRRARQTWVLWARPPRASRRRRLNRLPEITGKPKGTVTAGDIADAGKAGSRHQKRDAICPNGSQIDAALRTNYESKSGEAGVLVPGPFSQQSQRGEHNERETGPER
jgi:hypothetical protein